MTDEEIYGSQAREYAGQLDGLVSHVVVHPMLAVGRSDLLSTLLHDVVGKAVCSRAEASFLAGVRFAVERGDRVISDVYVAAREHSDLTAREKQERMQKKQERRQKEAGRNALLDYRLLNLISSIIARTSHMAFVAGALAAERRAVVA